MADRLDYAYYEFKLCDWQWNREIQLGYVAHFRGPHKVLDMAQRVFAGCKGYFADYL